MKLYDIATKRTYEKNGEVKTKWSNVGRIAIFPATAEKKEGGYLELSMFPETKFYVFEPKPRATPTQPTQPPAQNQVPQDSQPMEASDAEISEIPF